MKTGMFQSAFAMVGEASLIGEAAEAFSQVKRPRAAGEIRRIVSAACAAKGGPERMTLNDWREAEQEIRRKLNL